MSGDDTTIGVDGLESWRRRLRASARPARSADATMMKSEIA